MTAVRCDAAHPDEVVTVELDCDDWPEPQRCTLTRRELADLLTLDHIIATDDL